MALTKVTSDVITDSAVTAAKIADGTVVAAEIANNAVIEVKIANSAVTDAKIAAVAASKLTGTLPDARFPATLPAASGVNLTALNGTQVTSGTLPDARFPATLPATSGVNLTALNATQVTSGTLPDARFPSTLPATSAANLTSIPAGNLTGTVADARMSALAATKLTGSIADARIPASAVTQHVDTSTIENDIAVLGFKVATADSLAKYNLVDQVIDEFVDSSGIDAGASTNETLSGGYYSGSGSDIDTHFGITSSMLTLWANKSGSSYQFYNHANAASGVTDGNLTGGGFSVYSAPIDAGSYVRIDLGSGNEQAFTKWRVYHNAGGSAQTFWKIQWSTDNSSWNDVASALGVGATGSAGDYQQWTWSSVGAKRYWRMYQTADQDSNSTSWHTEIRVYPGISYENLTLQSVATTAEAAPTTGDMVMLIEDGAGTATINTDVKGYVSRDGGSNWTQGTLVSEGSWGSSKKILTFHNLDISGQPSGTSMKYKITTHNQAVGKQTRIHAVSLAWA